MDDAQPLSVPVRITLGTPEDTTRLARWLGARLGPGDTMLIEGPIGAGKSHFCRGLIQSRLSALGRSEDVPSPTFTLVQVYDAGAVEIWHADLYRLAGPDEVMELGLEQAFDTAICLVEWPDRLAAAAPSGALQQSMVTRKPASLWTDAWRRLVKNKGSVIGMIIVAIFLCWRNFIFSSCCCLLCKGALVSITIS